MSSAIQSQADSEQRGKQLYDLGSTSVFTLAADPRFVYTLYVPESLGKTRQAPRLVVAMHGTGRQFVDYRNAYAEFGRWNNCVILCPLFPIGVLGDGNRSGFKYIQEGDIRYDEVLLAMVDEVARKYGLDFSTFALTGFSGGGHFAHRFAYLHPERLWAVSVGAPGSVTLIDPSRDWWVGTRDLQARFGKALDLAALSRVPVHMIVGKADLETWEITHKPGSRYYMEGANDAGVTRPDRLQALKRSMEQVGVQVTLDLVDNMSHQGLRSVEKVQAFLAAVINGDIQ